MGENKVKVNATFHEQLENNQKWAKEKEPAYKEYRRKWMENPARYIIEKAPIHLDIETSSICNLRCPMCMCTIDLEKGKSSKIKKGLMDWQLYTKIIDEAAQIGVSSVKLNWRGEPTLHKRLADMIRYAKEKGILDIMINTNAVLLTEQMARDFIRAGLDKIFFSVDSIDPKKYESIRIGAKFDEVIANIKLFAKINEEAGHPVYTRVQKVLMNATEEENEEFKDFFGGFLDQVAFEDYIPYGEREYGKKVERKQMENVRFSCAQLWQRLLITWDGECRICCADTIHPLVIANVKEKTIEEIWNCEKIQKIREYHKQGEWYKVDLCKDCYIPYM